VQNENFQKYNLSFLMISQKVTRTMVSMQGAQKLRSGTHERVRRSDEVEAQSRPQRD